MAAVLTVVNNSTAVSNGFYRPRFTMNVKGLDTRKKTLNLESAQFKLHYENIDPSTNKLYVKIGDSEQQLDLMTGTYTNIEDLLSVITETLKNAKHQDIQFSYSLWAVESALRSRKERHTHWRRIRQVWYWVSGRSQLNTTSLALTLSPSPSIFPREGGLFCCTPIW